MMEDSGGMVAVVQGLEGAGLAVTLLSHRHPSGRVVTASLTGAACPTQACQRVVDTATETAVQDRAKNTLYRSSYQMAHCQPSGYKPADIPQYSFYGLQQYHGYTSRSPDEEAFVESLRKYPSSPVRSRSAELIERMLSYTQTKNGSRYSNTRSAKSFPSKQASKYMYLHSDEIPTKDTGIATNDLKSNFGYKRDVELIPSPTSNRKSRYDNQVGMYDYLKANQKDKLKGSEVRYLTNVKQCLRERLRQICDEDPVNICPKIQNRYSQHRRKYHRANGLEKPQKLNYCKNLEKCTNCQESMTQASLQNEIRISPSTSREQKESGANKSLSSFKHSKACFCDRPGPCDCGTQSSRSFLKPIIPEHRQCIPISECVCNKNEPYGKILKEMILKWSQDLPVHANFDKKDSMKRREVIYKLIDTLSQLQNDNLFFEKVEDEIKKCIKELPMWRPENKEDQESFENQLVLCLLQKIKSVISQKHEYKDEISKWIDGIKFTRNNIDKETVVNELIDKLRPITLKRPVNEKDYKEALKFEIANTLNDLPIEFTGSRTSAINNIADKLVDKLHTFPFQKSDYPKFVNIKNVVLEWLKNIPKISNDLDLNDDILVNDLITRLSNLQNQDTDNRHEQINDVITKWLNIVEEKNKCRIDRNMKNILTKQLKDTLISDSHQIHQQDENVNNVVHKWFDDIKDKLGVNFVDNQKDVEILVTKLQNLQSTENNENQQNSMRQEISTWLHNLQGKQGRYIKNGIQENLINKLISMIKDKPSIQKNVSETGLITQNIWNWLESQPEFRQDNSLQNKHMVIELSGKLQDIKDKNSEITEPNLNTELTKWFEKLSKERGITVGPNNQKKLHDKLLSAVSPTKRGNNWETRKNIQDLISKEVSDVINDLKIPLEEHHKEQLREQIIQSINQNWNDIQTIHTNEPIVKIRNILKHATKLSDSQITSLAHKLIEKIRDILSNLDHTIQKRAVILDYPLKEKLKSKVEYILKMLPLKDKEHIIDTITDILVKNYEDVKIDSGFDVIYELLKKSNVNETESEVVTNKILDMSNQFRNEVTDTTYKSSSYGSAESLWMQKQIFMQRLEREITDFMEKVLNESSSFYKDTLTRSPVTSEPLTDSVNHYNKFIHPLKTSTPTKTDSVQDIKIESKYKYEMKEIIRNWITNLQIDIDECFKNEMVNDIASDIIDRERYIQLSKIKYSSQDKMEHLKYQVFKWTSKLPNPIDLTAKTAELKKLMKSLEVLGIPNFIEEINERKDNAYKNMISNSSTKLNSNIITQDTGEFIEENIYGAIWNWLSEIPALKVRSIENRQIIDELITELSKKLKNILSLEPNLQMSNTEKLCKDEIINYFKKMNLHLGTVTEEQLEHRANELIDYLKCLQLFAKNLKQNQEISREISDKFQKKEAIKKAVQGWCQKLPLKTGKNYDDMKHVVENLAEAVSQYLLVTDMDNINVFMDEILNNLKKLPLQFDKEDSKYLPEFTERLIEGLKGVLSDSEKLYNITGDANTVQKPVFKKAAEIIYDNIQNWCQNLPLDLGITKDDIEQVNVIKQNLARKLLKKVGELNLDPEIFHDDYLYDNVLKDEIEKILDGLAKTEQLQKVLPTLKENLIKELLEAKEGIKNEIAGFAYKQQLRDAISKTLSSVGLSISEDTPFEVLKDNLADAFISLHYVADDELKRKFKDKIFNEVNKFCDDYLKRNPSTPINAYQLNLELYKALKNVPLPKEESMRREVEQIRVKDIVSDWFKDLALQETPVPIQKNKIISILAKKLHEIENEAELNPNLDVDETMNNEISKWLKKFQMKTENELNIESIKKNLIDKLKATKKSRKFNETIIRKSINYEDLTNVLDGSSYYPPSNLSADDRFNLQRIKDKTSIGKTNLKISDRNDASFSPGLMATGMQTEDNRVSDHISHKISQNASIQTIIRDPELPTSITPQVIVKEYYWNSHGSPTMQRSSSVLSSMQSPATQLDGNNQQKANIDTPRVTTASQTKPLPASMATITKEASIEQVIKTQIQNDSIGTSTKNSCLTQATTSAQPHISNKINISPQTRHYDPDDYLQLNFKKRLEIKSCQPCRGRAVLSGELKNNPEVSISNGFQQNHSSLQQMEQETNKRTDFHENRPEFWSVGHDGFENQNNLNQPCFRRPLCHTPIKDLECLPKRKRRNQQPCTCRNPVSTKCTIRPHSPCQLSHHSNKSCYSYVARKHCPKCWEGFCPHPSYLYFTQG